MLLLKTACFGLWFTMMLTLCLAKKFKPGDSCKLVFLHLDDPEKAEQQIYSMLKLLMAGEKLQLEISGHNPAWSEIYFIASRISQKYPAICIHVPGIMENQMEI